MNDMGQKIFFTVGPTQLYSDVKDFLLEGIKKNIYSINHRSDEFTEISRFTINQLKKLLNIPDNFYIFFLSSATECMERIIENLVEEQSYHFVNGFFARRFYNISNQLKKRPLRNLTGYGDGIDFSNISIPEKTELICLTVNETSTGAAINDMAPVYNLKKEHPDKIFALDAVTSVPYYRINFDYIDTAFFSVQKGFGIPAGLGVLIINKKCIEKTIYLRGKGHNIGSFNNFINLAEKAEKYQTSVTPNVLGIYLLGKVCKLLNKEGLKSIRSETDKKSELIYSKAENFKNVKPFVRNPGHRSKTTICLQISKAHNKIYSGLTKKGLIVSNGYGDFKNKHIRIGNFPMHKISQVKLLMEEIGKTEKK
ncbi:MAG: aminotransferase class V-fold PLP-dependent enzyme [Ignavibacteria bacterium]|nr:aminotransferase class V-fold PLP-dependent enzyme [Ignavibacteria bacterium]